LRRRPEEGLLGGMLEPPGTDWTEDGPTVAAIGAAAPFAADWRESGLEARHTFTHFHLRLQVRVARIAGVAPAEGCFTPRAALDEAALPTVMRKALTLGLSALDGDETA